MPRWRAMSIMLSTTSDRPADLLQLQHQPQGEPQVGGVGDAQQNVGPRLAGQAAEHDVARHLFVRAAGAQRIGAGQVDQREAVAGRRAQRCRSSARP